MSVADTVWRDIKGYEGKYQVSRKGEVKSLARIVKRFNTTKMQEERMLSKGKDGCVTLSNGLGTISRRVKVEKLVREAFPDND